MDEMLGERELTSRRPHHLARQNGTGCCLRRRSRTQIQSISGCLVVDRRSLCRLDIPQMLPDSCSNNSYRFLILLPISNQKTEWTLCLISCYFIELCSRLAVV